MVENTARKLVKELLKMKEYIDLIVPRGGSDFIRFVVENSLIPVVKHDKGVCHLYLHPSAKKEKAIEVILNAKIQRPSVCNALETLLIDKRVGYIKEILDLLQEKGVKLHADAKTQAYLEDYPLEPLTEEGYHKEYLSKELSIKVVENEDHAIKHIEEYSSGHSDGILAEDYTVIQKFLEKVDSAALFVNASTRFHDGYEFGLGAEVGISTNKLHVRGPMGLKDLTTTKYIIEGEYHIRS